MPSSGPPRVPSDEPPAFLHLASNPLRWRLLRELVRSDRAVKELVTLVGEPQNLVSYHLRLLRDGGLVSARRSSADGRDSYYSIDLPACRDALGASGAALHPALGPSPDPGPSTRGGRSTRRPRVLFLCTGNSARSQMAEALLVRMSNGAIDSRSAGTNPKPLHRNAVRALRRRGVDISAQRSKHVDELAAERFDTVITLCDRVREVCPDFSSEPELVHWSVPDPSLQGSTDRETYPAFERTAVDLETRISFRLPVLINEPTNRRHPHAER
jgi:ArsR family transcriptional regulator, arsenate/arsenite/antimonite-responsive transcriptional repressor / arsenate reductase (thioredoxin)